MKAAIELFIRDLHLSVDCRFVEYRQCRLGRIWDQINLVPGRTDIKCDRTSFRLFLNIPTGVEPKSFPPTCSNKYLGGSSIFCNVLIKRVISFNLKPDLPCHHRETFIRERPRLMPPGRLLAYVKASFIMEDPTIHTVIWCPETLKTVWEVTQIN